MDADLWSVWLLVLLITVNTAELVMLANIMGQLHAERDNLMDAIDARLLELEHGRGAR